MNTQSQLIAVSSEKLSNTKETVSNSITERHAKARDEVNESLDLIFNEDVSNSKNNKDTFDEMEKIIKGLLD